MAAEPGFGPAYGHQQRPGRVSIVQNPRKGEESPSRGPPVLGAVEVGRLSPRVVGQTILAEFRRRKPHPPPGDGKRFAQAPSPKSQAPKKLETSSSTLEGATAAWEFGAWCFFGSWSLGFGACGLLAARLRLRHAALSRA